MNAGPPLIKPPAGPVRLRSRWRPEHFIHVEHDALEVGAVKPGWQSACWSFEPVDNSPFVIIRNSFRLDCLQMRDVGLRCGDLTPNAQGAHWYIERVKGTAFVRLRNRWRHECYVNCEGRSLEATPIEEAWQSAHWEFV